MQVRRVSRAVQARAPRRGLSTARAALQVAWLLAARPAGVRADEVAAALGKSVSTAYNVLASLCEEGVAVRHPGGLYRLAPAFRARVAEGAPPPPARRRRDFSALTEQLFARTHKRAYVAVPHERGLLVVAERGQRGMARLHAMDPEISHAAHALALGKVALALAGPDAVQKHVDGGLPAFTSRTITQRERLRAELEAVRRTGVAVDCEEFAPDVCCLAAPILDSGGHLLAIAGIAMTPRAYLDERSELEAALVEVAGRASSAAPSDASFQACADPRELLEARRTPDLLSAIESTNR